MGLETWLYEKLGQYDDPYTHPPGDQLRFRKLQDTVVNTSNDGFELWIGTADEWYWHCQAPEARKLAWFILWNWWAKATWFGLKRWLWYKLLTRRCNRHRQAGKQ